MDRLLQEGITCPACERESGDVSEHHLIPKSYGGKDTVTLCHSCHRQIHALFDNSRLASDLNSLDKLLKTPEFSRYVKWARKQNPDKRFKVRASKQKSRKS